MKKETLPAMLWLFVLFLAVGLSPFLIEKAQGMDFGHALEAPSLKYWFGTDSLGRDLLSRLICGAGVSLGVSGSAVVLAVFLGMFVGALAGYYGGWWDRAADTLINLFLCFPTFFLILAVIAVVGPNAWNLIFVLAATSWMGTARLVRAEVLSLKEKEFILAARVMGSKDRRIIFKHLIPNAIGPVLVNAVLGFSSAVLTEAGLSFLGVGIQPPAPSWGNILMDGRQTLGVGWWLLVFPGVFIFLTVLSVNVLGEKFHDALRGRP